MAKTAPPAPAQIPEGWSLTPDGFKCPIDLLDANPELLREVDRGSTKYSDLVASIRSRGVLEAIQVRPSPKKPNEPQRYYVCNGFHRFTASKDLGLVDITVQLKDWDDNATRVNQIVLNAQHVPTRRVQYAAALSRHFASNPTETLQSVADQIGMSKEWIKEQLSLLNLNDDIQVLVDQDAMPVNNAVMLAKLNGENQAAFLPQAQQLSVADFSVVVDEQVKRERKDRAAGKPSGDPVFTAKPFARKTEEVEALRTDPSPLYNQLIVNGAKDGKGILAGALDWFNHMDPVSIKEQETEFYKRLQDRKDAKLKNQKEKLDAREKEIAEQRAAVEQQLKDRGLAGSPAA